MVDGPAGPFTVGLAIAGPQGWIEYTPGDAPLVLIAPHGGRSRPDGLPDRNCSGCVTVNDSNTQEVARLIASAFLARTGTRPHLIVNQLDRRKFDANRDLEEASGGNRGLLEPTWRWMHGAIDSAKADAARRWQHGLVLDLHGHGHAIARLELGYLLSSQQLRLPDNVLSTTAALRNSSIARLLAADSTRLAVDILRGAGSLGALFVAQGVPAVPSPAAPAPLSGEAYFSGGYNTARHGSRAGGPMDAVQIEMHFPGIRDTPAHREAFADRAAEVLEAYLRTVYGWTP